MVTFGEKIQDIMLLVNVNLSVGLQCPIGPQQDRCFLYTRGTTISLCSKIYGVTLISKFTRSLYIRINCYSTRYYVCTGTSTG